MVLGRDGEERSGAGTVGRPFLFLSQDLGRWAMFGWGKGLGVVWCVSDGWWEGVLAVGRPAPDR